MLDRYGDGPSLQGPLPFSSNGAVRRKHGGRGVTLVSETPQLRIIVRN